MVTRSGDPLTDGTPTPILGDGMAAFPGDDGRIILVRNHEITTHDLFGDPRTAYDPRGGGGTTTLVVDPESRAVVRDFVSLNGTITNCAGGPTPWGSWLSCEEHAFGVTEGFGRDHGYVYEVPASMRPRGDVSTPLKAMGRFKHEAVAVDPGTGFVYLTEDYPPGAGFYRFTPTTRGRLADGGRLEMLAIRDRPQYDTRRNQRVGATLPVTWVSIRDPDPVGVGQHYDLVFQQGHEAGGATFTRLEGCWWGDGCVYFDATTGGDAGMGQIWRFRPDRQVLELVFESPGVEVLANPDNLCWSPRGGLVVCEDPVGSEAPYIRGVTADGRLFDVAHNILSSSEFAGATFSPDGRTLFVNIQDDGHPYPAMTFAIWGPWERGSL